MGRNEKLKEWQIRFRMLWDRIKGKKIIILDIEEITFVPYVLPIVDSLRTKTDAISFYVGSHYVGHPEIQALNVSRKKQFNTKLYKKLTQADIFLSPHIYGIGPKNSIKIHINHNQPVKFESYQKSDFVNFDIHFLTSPLHREQTENTIKKYKLEEQNIILYDIGYSKSDKLLHGKYNREDVLNDLNLDPSLKTILYAPSWDEGLSLRSYGEDIIEKILEMEEINLIVKLHPITYCPKEGPNYLFYTGGIDWIERLSKFNSYRNFVHVPTNDIDPLLSASDVMITDVSSVALEFIMLDKPVIYIDCPEFYEKILKQTYNNFGNTTAEYVKNDPKANAGRHVGIVVYDIDTLPEAILRSMGNPGEFSPERKNFAKRLSYNPGNAADVAANTIIKLLKIND